VGTVRASCMRRVAGSTGLEAAASGVTGRRCARFGLFRSRRPRDAGFIEQRYGITLNCWEVSTTPIGALAGGEAESAEISSDMPTPDVTPAIAKP